MIIYPPLLVVLETIVITIIITDINASCSVMKTTIDIMFTTNPLISEYQ